MHSHEQFDVSTDHHHVTHRSRRDPSEAGNQVVQGPGSHNGRTLSESSAWKGDVPADPESDPVHSTEKVPLSGPSSAGGIKPPTVPGHSHSNLSSNAIKELRRIGAGGISDTKNSFTR